MTTIQKTLGMLGAGLLLVILAYIAGATQGGDDAKTRRETIADSTRVIVEAKLKQQVEQAMSLAQASARSAEVARQRAVRSQAVKDSIVKALEDRQRLGDSLMTAAVTPVDTAAAREFGYIPVLSAKLLVLKQFHADSLTIAQKDVALTDRAAEIDNLKQQVQTQTTLAESWKVKAEEANKRANPSIWKRTWRGLKAAGKGIAVGAVVVGAVVITTAVLK